MIKFLISDSLKEHDLKTNMSIKIKEYVGNAIQ